MWKSILRLAYDTHNDSFRCSGMILMAVVACCSDFSVRKLIKLGKQADKHYYEQLVQSQFGHAGTFSLIMLACRSLSCTSRVALSFCIIAGYVAVSAAMGIFAYGAMVAYLIGIGGTMSLVFTHWAGISLTAHPWVGRAVLITSARESTRRSGLDALCSSAPPSPAVFPVLPLAALKNMAVLAKTSAISLLSVIFIICVVIANAPGPSKDTVLPRTAEEKELLFIDSNFFPAIGIIAFAFVCHHACFIVGATLREGKLRAVLVRSTLI